MDRGREGNSMIARPNGRPVSQLMVKQDGRKPLFSSITSRGDEHRAPTSDRAQQNMSNLRVSGGGDGFSRRGFSDSQMSAASLRSVSPGSRIPKPTGSGLSNRKAMSLAEAYQMAGQEDEPTGLMDASPSPAPRLWRERRESDAKNMRTFIGRSHLETKAPDRPFSRQSMSALPRPETRASLGRPESRQTLLRPESRAAALMRPESRAEPERSDTYKRRLYGKSRIGLGSSDERPKSPAQTPPGSPMRSPMRKESIESTPADDSENKPQTGSDWFKRFGSRDSLNGSSGLPELVPGIEDLPLPSIENGGRQQPTPPSSRQASANAANPSPEKSFAWQIDQDFTAGDLQISDSPRIKIDRPFANRIKFDDDNEVDINSRTRVAPPGSRNTKLDEIRSREVKAGSDIPAERSQSRQSRLPNTKLDDILAREAQVESQIPIPDRNLPRPRNTKLDDIRQREINGVPRRAFAASRLEEIREQNSLIRSRSPEERPRSSRGLFREASPSFEVETRIPARPRSAFEPAGVHIPDASIAVHKTREQQRKTLIPEPIEKDEDHARPMLSTMRTDSRELLRRLARAASTSPAPETEAPKRASLSPPEKPVTQASDFRSGTSRRSFDSDNTNDPPVENPTRQRSDSRPTTNRRSWDYDRRSDSSAENPAAEGTDSRPTTNRRSWDTGKKSDFSADNPADGFDSRPTTHRRSWDDDGRSDLSSDNQAAEVADSRRNMQRRSLDSDTRKSPSAEDLGTESTDSKPSTSRRSSDNDRRGARREARETETAKPKVDFADSRRNRSRDSVKSKQSSMQSETDPTDRIEAEMKLFAPGENQSERGSLRVPSPEPDDEQEEDVGIETPRPQKPDPLTMPTPKVTGAYVETPVTVKVEKKEVKEERKPAEEKKEAIKDAPRGLAKEAAKERARPRGRSASVHDRKRDSAWKGQDPNTASDPGTDDQMTTMTTSTGPRRRRALSLPRRKGPLKNSGKLPSVKNDLRELQRTNNIEDSTLDDLEEVLLGKKAGSPNMRPLIKDLPSNPSAEDFDLDNTLDDFALDTQKNTKHNVVNTSDPEHSDGDFARITRMGQTLVPVLRGIHTAKQGIERLENHVYEDKPTEEKVGKDDARLLAAEPSLACAPHASSVASSVGQLPLSRVYLYRRTPSFRLTLLGILFSMVAFWAAAETLMCANYCRPTSCGSTPCVWSFDDPTPGNALPVKLDQWATGGRGRVLFENLLEQTYDACADLEDWVRSREITDVDINALSFEQKRQHRRRLHKKGLLKARPGSPEQRAKWDAWQQTRLAKERARQAREMGYEVGDGDEETIGGDQRVW